MIIQDLVRQNRRCVKHITISQYRLISNLDASLKTNDTLIGVTGSAFDPIGGFYGPAFVAGITNGSAKLSRVSWNFTPNDVGQDVPSMTLMWQDNSLGIDLLKALPTNNNGKYNAVVMSGSNGDFSVEKFTISNPSTTPSGYLYLVHTSYDGNTLIPSSNYVSGSMTLEFVL